MPLTLEERERIAYITNSPDHALLVEAIEGDEAVCEELEQERDKFKENYERAESENNRLQEDLEAVETKAERLTEEVEQLEGQLGAAEHEAQNLRAQIRAAGVDLV